MAISSESEKRFKKPVDKGGFEIQPKKEQKVFEAIETPEKKLEDAIIREEKQRGVISKLTGRHPEEPEILTIEDQNSIKKIEGILAEDLDEIFLSLSPADQQLFKARGEEVAKRIHVLIKKVKVKVKEILNLIKLWLGMIPGVNKFFSEQEAKIKTEKILKIKDKNI